MKNKSKSSDCSTSKVNKRLSNCNPTNNEGTAAWQDTRQKHNEDLVNKPDQDMVSEAKDWVDNGSKL